MSIVHEMKNIFAEKMKMSSTINKVILVSLALLTSPLQAREGSGSHGGDAVRLSDDRVVLADSFLKANSGGGDHSEGGKRFVIYPELKGELQLVSELLGAYGCKVGNQEHLYKHSCEFIDKDVLDKETEYYLVDKLDQPECSNRVEYKLPDGAQLIERAACTYGGRTYLRTDVFSKMSVREQAKLMVHERLRALPKAPFLKDIAVFTNGLETVLSLYYQQKAGQWRDLVSEELASINGLLAKIVAFKFYPAEGSSGIRLQEGRAVTARGGGLVSKGTRIAAGAFVGIGSVVKDNTWTIAAGARVFQSDLGCGLGFIDSPKTTTCRIGQGALIHQSYMLIQSGGPGARSSIVDSRVSAGGELSMVAGAKIVKSTVRAQALSMGADSRIEDSNYEDKVYNSLGLLELQAGAKMIKANLHIMPNPMYTKGDASERERQGLKLTLAQGAKLANINDWIQSGAPYGFRQVPVTIQGQVVGTRIKHPRSGCLSLERGRREDISSLRAAHQTIGSLSDWMGYCSIVRRN